MCVCVCVCVRACACMRECMQMHVLYSMYVFYIHGMCVYPFLFPVCVYGISGILNVRTCLYCNILTTAIELSRVRLMEFFSHGHFIAPNFMAANCYLCQCYY